MRKRRIARVSARRRRRDEGRRRRYDDGGQALLRFFDGRRARNLLLLLLLHTLDVTITRCVVSIGDDVLLFLALQLIDHVLECRDAHAALVAARHRRMLSRSRMHMDIDIHMLVLDILLAAAVAAAALLERRALSTDNLSL